ncbi:hypothetical protein NKH77_04880 [Streptomyces sp. M19]
MAVPLHKAPMVKERRGTHITRFDALIYDRTVWNKIFRRSFWDYHFIEFPRASSTRTPGSTCSPTSAPRRSTSSPTSSTSGAAARGAAPSITQRHTELGNLRDRVSAVRSVSRFLGGHRARAYRGHKRKYDLACLTSDLMLHLKVLPDADDAYRGAFMEWANQFLDEADPPSSTTCQPTPGSSGCWSARACSTNSSTSSPSSARAARCRSGAASAATSTTLPGRPRRRPGQERLPARQGVVRPRLAERRGVAGKWLSLTGFAYIRFINVHRRHMSVKGLALRNKKQRRFLVTSARTRYFPQATEYSNQSRYCYDWAGFETRFDTTRLKRRGRWVEGTWDVATGVFSRGLFRRRGITRGGAGTAANPPYRYVDRNTRIVRSSSRASSSSASRSCAAASPGTVSSATNWSCAASSSGRGSPSRASSAWPA